jgi:hypothetical protein
MDSGIENFQRGTRQLLRFVIIGSVVASTVAYSLLIALNLQLDSADRVAWYKIAVGPLSGYCMLYGGLWLTSRMDFIRPRHE